MLEGGAGFKGEEFFGGFVAVGAFASKMSDCCFSCRGMEFRWRDHGHTFPFLFVLWTPAIKKEDSKESSLTACTWKNGHSFFFGGFDWHAEKPASNEKPQLKKKVLNCDAAHGCE